MKLYKITTSKEYSALVIAEDSKEATDKFIKSTGYDDIRFTELIASSESSITSSLKLLI